MNNDSNPVVLLRDARGVYGIGISDSFDADKIRRDKPIVLRPDRFRNDDVPLHFYKPALQKIVSDLHQQTREDFLRRAIHCEALKRTGLQPLSSGQPPKNWWSSSEKRQERNRDIYYQLRHLSFDTINNLIGEALEVADKEALKATRRFAIEYRESIYRIASFSRRALQLTDTFPVLAAAIYTDHHHPRSNTAIAAHMIERGVRLRDVAEYMSIPMVLRRIKPGAVNTNDNAFRQHPELLNFLPTTTFNQKVWLSAVSSAFSGGGEDFAAWAAKHFAEMPRQQEDFVSDVSDWARMDKHDELITRPFQLSMSVATVVRLSAEWHEAVIQKKSGPRVVFPAPWYPAANINGYDITPIDNSTDLHREGAVMHHCVASYVSKIMEEKLYVYSVHSNDRRVATFSLRRGTAAAQLDQLKGPYNSKPAREVTSAVRRWLREIRQTEES